MKTFIEEYVSTLESSQRTDWSQMTIVVPNKLVGFYLQKALRGISGQVTWAPTVCTLPELASNMAKRELCSQSQSMMYLLQAYQRALPSSLGALSNFMKWGQKIHSDFIDISNSMADARQIYRDLRNVKELDHWQIGEDELSISQQQFLIFWNALETIFEHWKELQEESKSMVYPVVVRYLLNNVRLWSDDWVGRRIDVVGMGGFQKSEELLLQMLGNTAEVRVIWDADKHYIANDWHEAGLAIRKHAHWLHLDAIPNLLAQKPIHITHVTCDSFHGQCAALAHSLKQSTPDELASSAVILPDEKWLMPILHALAGQGLLTQRLSENMQYGHPLVKWISSLLHIHGQRRVHTQGYFNRDLMEIVDLSKGWILSQSAAQALQDVLLNASKGYWDKQSLKSAAWFDDKPAAWESLFFPASGNQLLKAIVGIIEGALNEQTDEEQSILQALFNIQTALIGLEDQAEVSTIKWLWNMEAQHLRIGSIRNQAGELQVLLMTDTRALDFERVFIPGLNEGTIPKKSAMESFIPFDIRALQGMNLPLDAEASYAYVFYRLIQRASSLVLFSSTVDIQKRDQEASRYVRQIKTELLSENPDMKWSDVHFQLDLPVSPALQMPPHNDWSKSRVEELIAGGLSASALNKFKECPLDYYFRYIAKVGEAEELDETISDAEMGTLAHTVLEDFYKDFINRYPSKDDFDEVIAQLDKWIDVAVSKSKRQMDLNVGNNALIRVTTKGMLERYFRFEQASLQAYPISREIIAVEQPFDFMADPTTGVRLRGKMDRVERLGNSIRILDYKTGKVMEADTELKMRTKANDLFDKQSSKMIQIMTYILAARHLYPHAESIDAGFISFRSIGKGWQMFESDIPFDQCEQGFKKFLNEIIERMRQMGTWEHTQGARYCEYCESLGFDLESETAMKTEGDESTE